jgi:AcrR family transcriptional regulator
MVRIRVAFAMSPKTPPLPRKNPSQERSRETVARILEAAGRILVADGYEHASTKRIAAAAGISPGSLYQYFPNKEAVVVATVEQMVDTLAENFIASLPHLTDADPDRSFTAMLETLLVAMDERRELIRVLVEEVPHLGGSTQALHFERRISDLATGYLNGVSPATDRRETAVAVWMVVACVSNLTARYVLERPPIPRAQFVAELRRLVLAYLAPILQG